MDRRGWLLSAYTVNDPRRVRTWKNMVCMAFLQIGQTYLATFTKLNFAILDECKLS